MPVVKEQAMKLATLKGDMVTLQEEIIALRKTRKKCPYGLVPKLEEKSRDYRYLHVAYCEIRGTARKLIEVPRKGNELDEVRLQKVKDKYMSPPEG